VKLSVQLGDELAEVTPIAGDLVHFERQFGEGLILREEHAP
jgi:hypothetical protein